MASRPARYWQLPSWGACFFVLYLIYSDLELCSG